MGFNWPSVPNMPSKTLLQMSGRLTDIARFTSRTLLMNFHFICVITMFLPEFLICSLIALKLSIFSGYATVNKHLFLISSFIFKFIRIVIIFLSTIVYLDYITVQMYLYKFVQAIYLWKQGGKLII